MLTTLRKIEMKKRNALYFIIRIIIFIPLVLLSTGVEAGQGSLDIKKLWGELLTREPFAYTVPLVHKSSLLDGAYTKRAKKTNAIVPCRRCPDWLPETGIWKMQLNKGTYRIIHKATGWKSIGTFIVAGDRVLFANDPVCPEGIGVYHWKLETNRLMLLVIDDPCAIKLRAKNLTETPWLSCQSPNIEAGITGHWPKPEGCD
jgi:hypothetical protein